MTVPVMQFEAKKHGYRQTQDGIVVSFVVHPNDVSADLAVAPLGTHYVVVVAPYTEQSPPSSTGSEHRVPDPKVGGSIPAAGTTPRERRPFSSLPRSQQAVLLCKDERFWKWLGAHDEKAAAEDVRDLCRVQSRSEFDRDPAAGSQWDALHSRYRRESGLDPEPRG